MLTMSLKGRGWRYSLKEKILLDMNWMTCGGSEMPNVFSQENFYSSLDLPMKESKVRIRRC